jgi:hypothetical protein
MFLLSRHFALCVIVSLAVGGSFGIVCAQVPVAPAANSTAEVELQRALDQPFNLVLDKVEIAEAFKRIAATAKISLNVDPACYDCLPYGATTRVSADFRNSKLRDAIEQVLVTLGLQQTVTGANVIIRPSGPLLHIGRRAQLDELKLLQDLRSNDLAPIQGDAALDWTTAIRGALDRQNIVVVMDGSGGDAKALEEVKKQLPMSVFRGLEAYCQLTNQIWFAESDPLSSMTTGATVRIMPMKKWIERQLERPIQVNFVNAPFDQVVAELSHLTGIRFVPEPGLYQAFPALNLSSVNSSVAQTLEALAGTTRIVYDVREDSILLHVAGSAPAAATQEASKGDNVVGYMTIPVAAYGQSMNVFIRESDLPAAVDEMRKKKVQEMVEALEKVWMDPMHKESGGESGATTRAATKPQAVTK